MSLRKCDFDQHQAAFGCATHNGYYCLQHYAEHTSDRQAHIPFKIENALTPQSFQQLQIEVLTRIKALKQTKIQIIKKATELIRNIEDLCVVNNEKLDLEIQSYLSYIKDNNFDNKTLQQVSILLETQLNIEISESFKVNLFESRRKEKQEMQLIENWSN
jgi:hypothetical protein